MLPEKEAEMIRLGSKRIDNCSRTVIEMEWVEDGEGAFHSLFTLSSAQI